MSIRWRWDSGELLCGAKSEELPKDCYIDDRLHYQLSVELGVIVPDENEAENGLWHWQEKQPLPAPLESKEIDHHPNCLPSVYGRTEDPKDCICHSWVRNDPLYDYASIDPVKWGDIPSFYDRYGFDWAVGSAKEEPLDRVDKYCACPEELKEAYKAIREVRDALLKLEKKIETMRRFEDSNEV